MRCPAGPALAQWLGRYVREDDRKLIAPHLRSVAAAGAGADLKAEDVVNLFPRTKNEGLVFGLGPVARRFLHGTRHPSAPPEFVGAALSTSDAYDDRDLDLVALAVTPCPERWVDVLFRWSVEILDAPELRSVEGDLTGPGGRDATESEEETIRALVNEADVDTAFCRNGARAFRILRTLATMTSGVGAIVVDEALRRARSWDIPELSAVEAGRAVA